MRLCWHSYVCCYKVMRPSHTSSHLSYQTNTQAWAFSLRCFMTPWSVFVVSHIFEMTKIGGAALPAVSLSATDNLNWGIWLVLIFFFKENALCPTEGAPAPSENPSNAERPTGRQTDRQTDRQTALKTHVRSYHYRRNKTRLMKYSHMDICI